LILIALFFELFAESPEAVWK